MKNYVINLDRSPDRLARLKELFAALDIDLTRVTAVDGQQLSDDDISALTMGSLIRQTWPEALTRGEIACFLSHRRAIAAIAKGNEPYGAVFEDDVELGPMASRFLNSFDWIPKDADIIKIETHGKKTWLGAPQPVADGVMIARLKSSHIMAAAYIISRDAAERFLNHMQQATAPFDHLLFNPRYGPFDDFIIYQLDPAFARQAKMPSTLQAGRQTIDDKNRKKRSPLATFKRELCRLIRRSKTGIWGLYINLFTKESWKQVGFLGKR